MLNVKKIEAAMLASNFTKVQLCKISKISRPTLDSLLDGGDAKISTLVAVADSLKLRIGDLFDEESEASEHYEAHGANNFVAKHIGEITNKAINTNERTKITEFAEEIKFNDSIPETYQYVIENLKTQIMFMQNILEEKERFIAHLLSDKQK